MMQVIRKVWRKLRRIPPLFTASSQDDYSSRYAKELESFNDCTTVHELPLIFYYWSHKYLAPKFTPFGIGDPEQFFFLYAQKFHARFPEKTMRMVSIGCGNCDTEVRMAERLIENGITAFTIECLDINAIMLQRGRELAATAGVTQHIIPIAGDFNYWQPDGVYDLIVANQCLHHVLELENLFTAIKNCLNPEGYFLASDMIGRNGHLRWPEAKKVVDEFWQELPDKYRYNRALRRHEAQFINHDCSTEGFEGIRAQDILPLLVANFKFELFIPFANVVFSFIDRAIGHNFDATREWDKNFIDRVHARDEEGMLSGELKPTQMLAVLRVCDIETQLSHPKLTPEFCVRRTDS
jgi:SAM-dependent methyltransferase